MNAFLRADHTHARGDLLVPRPVWVARWWLLLLLSLSGFQPGAEAARRPRRRPDPPPPDYTLSALHFDRTGDLLAIANRQGTIQVWNVQTNRLAFGPFQCEESILDARFTADGKKLTVLTKSQAALWSTLKWASVTNTKVNAKPPYELILNPDAVRYLSVSENPSVLRIWDAITGRSIAQPIKPIMEGAPKIQFSADGRFFSTISSSSQSLNLFEVYRAYRGLFQWGQRGKIPAQSTHFSPDGNYLAVISTNQTLTLYEMATAKPAFPSFQPGASVATFQFSPDSKRFLIALKNGALLCRETETGKALWQSGKDPFMRITNRYAADFFPNGKALLVGSETSLRVWDAVQGRPQGPLIQCGGKMDRHLLSPDGKQIAMNYPEQHLIRVLAVGTNGTVSLKCQISYGPPNPGQP